MTFTFPVSQMMQYAYNILYSGLPVVGVFVGVVVGLFLLGGLIRVLRHE
ncbi:hypothetical protein [Dehalobacter sp.]|nr:hypothetical protein [Dehalobacter sp.]MDJ0304548.1 hypothetical protein [Dehalobacter sp.]